MSDENAVAWLRQVIEGDKAEAVGLLNDPEVADAWVESSTGVLQTGSLGAADHWKGCWPTGNGYLSRHIALHDPQDVIADCEAKLGILDEHRELGIDGGECARCTIWDTDSEGDFCATPLPWPCRSLTLLASAYRHREGYAGHWGTP